MTNFIANNAKYLCIHKKDLNSVQIVTNKANFFMIGTVITFNVIRSFKFLTSQITLIYVKKNVIMKFPLKILFNVMRPVNLFI